MTLKRAFSSKILFAAVCLTVLTSLPGPQGPLRGQQPSRPLRPSPPDPRAVALRGAYGRFRANNHLLSYDLDIRVDPATKSWGGKNTIRFRMLKDDSRIQLDLSAGLKIEKIMLGAVELPYTREFDAVFVDFPKPLKKGSTIAVDVYYSGRAAEEQRYGGISFRTDPAGRPWITTACQGAGAMTWWPNKEQQRDRVENMRLRVAIPNGLTDVSNGRLTGQTDLGDGNIEVRSTIQQPGAASPVQLNYSLHQQNGKWLIYDVAVDNISIAANYRNQFNRVINNQGFDTLLADLRRKQQGLEDQLGTPHAHD